MEALMETKDVNTIIERIGTCAIPTPLLRPEYVRDDHRVLFHVDLQENIRCTDSVSQLPSFEAAGPRDTIYFEPAAIACGIVTCGGLCPGLNDVIRAIVMSLSHHYGVKKIYGFRFGYEGLSSKYNHKPLELFPENVNDIHNDGGTILGSSRGPQDPSDMVDTLERLNVKILFTVGGDGTLRGAQKIAQEAQRRGNDIAVIGIPKTIDNDISCIDQSFGFVTAVTEAHNAIYSANMEAEGARNGIGLVKLMGRDSGFIAAFATLANSEVNYCLVPEIPFTLDGFLQALKSRIEKRGHAVIVVAEGAGQELLSSGGSDDSGNVLHGDIGIFLRDQIKTLSNKENLEINLKYIDPSYTIRSMPANAYDSVQCLLLGHNAVHAGMAGRTNMVVGYWKGRHIHVPISLAVAERKKIDPNGWLWSAVQESTGQPRDMT
jgi:6-phosphofructokinase 1